MEENLGVVEPGSCVGEADVLLNQPHSHSAQALTPVHVYALSRDALAHLCVLYPALGAHFARDLVEYARKCGGEG